MQRFKHVRNSWILLKEDLIWKESYTLILMEIEIKIKKVTENCWLRNIDRPQKNIWFELMWWKHVLLTFNVYLKKQGGKWNNYYSRQGRQIRHLNANWHGHAVMTENVEVKLTSAERHEFWHPKK